LVAPNHRFEIAAERRRSLTRFIVAPPARSESGDSARFTFTKLPDLALRLIPALQG
jgi:hypothetical protein